MTQTHRVGGFDNDRVLFEYDFDDATLLISTIRCINQTDRDAWGSATDLLRNRTYERIWPANATTEQGIPTGQGQRLELVAGGRGFSNVTFRATW